MKKCGSAAGKLIVFVLLHTILYGVWHMVAREAEHFYIYRLVTAGLPSTLMFVVYRIQ
jgi:hypothetical protein